MSPNTLILFDVDRTLISKSRSHRIAFIESIREIYGIDPSNSHVAFHGMTDPQIVYEVLRAKDMDCATIENRMDACLLRMTQVFEQRLIEDTFVALDGSAQLLEQLSNQGARLGLVTGNLEPIAWRKLERVGLRPFFSFGGFGSDHRDRATLVRLAIDRAKTMYGLVQRVWVVGDTPRDIGAAKAAGVKSLGVATGVYTEQELAFAGADHVCGNLSQPELLDLLAK